VADHLLTPATAPPGRWLFAKMQVAAADAQMHEFVNHLPLHLVLESVAVATHNWLPDHSVGRLLGPHLAGTVLVNWFARHTLVPETDSIVERVFSVGREGAMTLGQNTMNFSTLDFPAGLAERGLGEDVGLEFHYRGDGLRLWVALHRYLTAVVDREFRSDSAVARDTALQGWAGSVAREGEGGLPGFPARLATRAELARVLVMLVFGASVQHHALNARHYLYTYAPHRPTALSRWMPPPGPDLSWSWLQAALPTMDQQVSLLAFRESH
jgi:hypothetical protein